MKTEREILFWFGMTCMSAGIYLFGAGLWTN